MEINIWIYLVFIIMRRREFISGTSVAVAAGLSGCVDIPNSVVPDDEDEQSVNNGSIPTEGFYLGQSNQIDLRVFEVDYSFEPVGSAYRYDGSLYSFEEFGSIVAAEELRDEIQSLLTDSDILPDTNISVRTGEFDLSSVNNPEVRSEFTSSRFGNMGVIVDYIIENNGETPMTDLPKVIEAVPHSSSIIVQFDSRSYEAVVPVSVEVIVL